VSCSTVRGILYNYISAYVDDELSSTDRAAVEKHFEICPHCANEKFELEQMKITLHNEFAYSSPYGLEEDIMNRIAESAESDEKSENEGRKKFSWRWLNYVLPPLATAVAGVLIVLALLPKYHSQIDMEEQIVSAHVRSLLEDNLTHIESADTHKVEPWFKGKVDFVATAKDLTENGFILKGGRLDYLNKTNAASIIYQFNEHVINLFIFPTKEEDMASVKTFKNRGYNIVKWTNNGLEYCVISDLNIEYLKKFAELFRTENSISRIDTNFNPETVYLSRYY